jgi:hypothetical protein
MLFRRASGNASTCPKAVLSTSVDVVSLPRAHRRRRFAPRFSSRFPPIDGLPPAEVEAEAERPDEEHSAPVLDAEPARQRKPNEPPDAVEQKTIWDSSGRHISRPGDTGL